jgi:ElaB/YqjD/DUF883 family membrane-anchored ribosome-binding protein
VPQHYILTNAPVAVLNSSGRAADAAKLSQARLQVLNNALRNLDKTNANTIADVQNYAAQTNQTIQNLTPELNNNFAQVSQSANPTQQAEAMLRLKQNLEHLQSIISGASSYAAGQAQKLVALAQEYAAVAPGSGGTGTTETWV